MEIINDLDLIGTLEDDNDGENNVTEEDSDDEVNLLITFRTWK